MHAEAANTPSQKRRRSSENSLPIRVRLLGGFSVWVGSRAVSEGAWRLRKAKSLVKLLSLSPGHALHREQLMDLLWPELGKTAATNNLRGALHAARRALARVTLLRPPVTWLPRRSGLRCVQRWNSGWMSRPSRRG
jgi:DNA-binding SARP family transcriptional activator